MYRSNYFTLPNPPEVDSLEMVVSRPCLASHSQRDHFSPPVGPLSFRDPSMLARQAKALDDLRGAQDELGLGRRGIESEHTLFGYNLAT